MHLNAPHYNFGTWFSWFTCLEIRMWNDMILFHILFQRCGHRQGETVLFAVYLACYGLKHGQTDEWFHMFIG